MKEKKYFIITLIVIAMLFLTRNFWLYYEVKQVDQRSVDIYRQNRLTGEWHGYRFDGKYGTIYDIELKKK